jgi:putative PIN family toxin of toxin-antitoxin system
MSKNVVIDTNVVVSALMTPNGNPAKILELVSHRELQPFYNGDILAEYEDVLSRPELKINPEKKNTFISSIENGWILVEPAVSTVSMPDEDDRIFYDTAKEVGAIIITGNLKHYPDEPQIMTPAEYLGKTEIKPL